MYIIAYGERTEAIFNERDTAVHVNDVLWIQHATEIRNTPVANVLNDELAAPLDELQPGIREG